MSENGIQGNEAASDINAIESTPGFILPDDKGQFLRDINRPEYDRLEAKRDAAYKRAAEQSSETPKGDTVFETAAEAEKAAGLTSPPESNVAGLEQQSQLITAAEAEMKKLVELGFERAEIPLDISEGATALLKMQRLAAEENYGELYPAMDEMLLDEPTGIQDMASQFFVANDLDPQFRQEVTESILSLMNRARKQKEGSL